jgi:hypothetical protein
MKLKLQDYAKHADKKQWPDSLRMRLSRQEFLFQAALNEATVSRGVDHAADLQEAARALDEDRQGMSITKHYCYLKSRGVESGKGHIRPRRARWLVK